MIPLLFYYLALPFIASALVLKFIRKYGDNEIPEDIRRLYAERPIEPKWFRVLRGDLKGKRVLGDFETKGEAVDRAYKGREEARAAGEKAAFLVLNDKGEALEEVDS